MGDHHSTVCFRSFMMERPHRKGKSKELLHKCYLKECKCRFEEGPWGLGQLPGGEVGVVGNKAEGEVGSTKHGMPRRDQSYPFWLFWKVDIRGVKENKDDKMENWLYSLGSSTFLNPGRRIQKAPFQWNKKIQIQSIMRNYILSIRVTIFLIKIVFIGDNVGK